MSVIRAFIAIELSDEIQAGLQQTVKTLQVRAGTQTVRWVPVKNIHLTLVFLGDVDTTRLAALKDMLQVQVSARPTFGITAGGLGAFPSFRKPRVIWIGVDAPPDLAVLQRDLMQGTTRLGYPPEERPFSPHLTLGRVSKSASQEQVRKLGEILEAQKIGMLGAMSVRSVDLYRSDLQPNGAVYTRINSVSLSGTRSG